MSTVTEPLDSQAGAQQELPFAMVYGEALTELPVDLYSRRTRLRCFSKPSRARWTCCFT